MPSPTASGSSASHRSSIRRSFGRRLRRRSGSPRRRWPRELHDREILLLLDNFEQLIEAAEVVGELLQAAPRLRVLSTSRARLHVYGEHELEIPPLPAAEAEELFVSRARATGRELPPGELITEICSRLDGLPLAIELVAARTAELTPAELVSSLDDKLELASKGARDLPERQQTLRAAIGWSHDLLDPHQQRLFAQLGAFAGGFTRDAVQAVCGTDTTEQLAGLAEANLVRRADDGRFRMLQTIREYSVERLVESSEADERAAPPRGLLSRAGGGARSRPSQRRS